MTFLEILDTLFLGPLKLLFEIIFKIARDATDNIGASIFILSLVINLLILPLYMCADAMQERTRLREAELAPAIKHIKSTFKGDERMMVLQTFYKQNNYSPLSALSGAVSLLLEIPFFIAAYSFLSGVAEFQGTSLWFISDLSQPDGLLTIGSITINVLPFVMTLFNIIASVLFLKGAPLKAKIQLYAMAAFFLVFLYTSPSGLLLYWTLNNLFSLIKNIFYKFKHPRTILAYMISAIGVIIPILLFALAIGPMIVRVISLAVTLICQIPLSIYWLRKKGIIPEKDKNAQPPKTNRKVFLLGCAFIAILLGVLIPSNYIASSPTEFINSNHYVHPLWYVLSSACLAVGTFMIWFSVFYWLASPKGKVIFERVIWVIAIAMFVNYMFFGQELGNISASLQYDNGVNYSTLETILNVIAIVAIIVSMYFVAIKFRTVVIGVLAIAIGAIGTMSTVNLASAGKVINNTDINNITHKEKPSFNLSAKNQNVIVLMLDKAVGQYIPYLVNEKPELKDMFSGFTYYSNVICFGGYTNYTTPSLLGGYEYTPVELNKRDDVSLKEKQNEANLLMPRVFTESTWTNGKEAKATVFDPVYANYKWISDLSIYEDFENVKAANITGKFTDDKQNEAITNNNFRNFFCFSLMKTLPLPVQSIFYNDGMYNKVYSIDEEGIYSIQTAQSSSQATGIRSLFMDNYNNLVNLSKMTKILPIKNENGEIIEEDSNTFMFMCNNTTHEPMMLVEEDNYTPPLDKEGFKIDNTAYDQTHSDRFTVDGRRINLASVYGMQSYQTNMACLLRIGEWLEYLKANGVYDNTKIIIVSDHGTGIGFFDDFILNRENQAIKADNFVPLLMVKDFGAAGSMTESKEFMTNADVPTLAMQGVIANPINPYTNKAINNAEKTAHPQYIIRGTEWSIYLNNGNTFKKDKWASVDNTDGKANIYDPNDWSFLEDETILTEHSFE